MPWVPSYTKEEARDALDHATFWAEALDALGLAYHGKNIKTLRRWAARWEIPADHLPSGSITNARHRHTPAELQAAIASSRSWAEALRHLGYCDTGGNWRTLKRRVTELDISTVHFDPYAASREARRFPSLPLERILVRGSRYNRTLLKRRLYDSGLKTARCELCGQGETWQGKRISLILDHINGVKDDHRLENLRVVCPNCAATLDTHFGKKARRPRPRRSCLRCGSDFAPKYRDQRYCSQHCGTRHRRRSGRPRSRRRPPAEVLLREVDQLGYRAVGRKYGISDNAIRKWLREYDRERLEAEGGDPANAAIPTRTWPNRRR